MQSRFDKAAIRRGLNIFFGLSLASVAIIFVFTDLGDTRDALSRVQPLFLIVAIGLGFLDWMGGGLRLVVLSRGLSQRLQFRTGVRAAMANVAMGAMTPSQAGGGPAQVFVLYKGGVPFMEAMSVSLMTFMVTMIFFIIAAVTLVVLGIDESITNANVRGMLRYGVGLFLLFAVMFISFISSPRLTRTVVRWVLNFISLFRSKHLLHAEGRANRIFQATDEFHRINVVFLREHFPTLVLSVVITAALFGFKCLSAYFVVRGLGVDAAVGDVVAVQILILLAVYFFPTPGGAGAAEFGSAVLMASIVPFGLLPVFVILWRIVLMYFPVIIGSIVMIRAVGGDTIVAQRPGYGQLEKKIAVSGK